MPLKTPIYTIGHSTQNYDAFQKRLRRHEVTAVADVRSTPFSRHFPHFNFDELRSELNHDGIEYVFLGKELGGRPSSPDLYRGGVADYEAMSQTALFRNGLKRVFEGAQKYRIALLCSEHDPLDCHRCLLVGRAISRMGYEVLNILGDGNVASQEDLERELLRMAQTGTGDLFRSDHERLADAYRLRADRVAFRSREPLGKGSLE